MQSTVNVLLNPSVEVLVRMPLRDREEANWYAQMGMPMQGNVVSAIRRVITSQRVWGKETK
jgi:hypothetical protein